MQEAPPMKLGLVAFVVWSLATITGAMAQCSGTQICGLSTTVTNQAAVATFTPAVVKNEVFSIGDGTVANTLTMTTCQGNCTPPTLAQIAGYFANQSSPVSCPVPLPATLQSCTGNLPAGWSSGPATVSGANYTVTFTYSPAGQNTTPLQGNAAQGNAGVTITSNTAATTSLYGLLANKMVCVKNSDVGKTGSTPWYNQEWHQSVATPGGNITDYKMGPTHTVDPSKQLGTWSIGGTNDCVLTYVYSPNSLTFTYNVWKNGSTYTFCKLSGPDTPPIFSIPDTQIQGPGLVACTP
jgi:hypothetical protein